MSSGSAHPPPQSPGERVVSYAPGQMRFLWNGESCKLWIGWGLFYLKWEVLVPFLRVKSHGWQPFPLPKPVIF